MMIKDLTNFFEQGGTAGQLKALCNDAEIYLPFEYVQNYEHKFKGMSTVELFEYLDMLKSINQPKFYKVTILLGKEFQIRKEALEYKYPKKGGISLATA
jgi:hypothetical protein